MRTGRKVPSPTWRVTLPALDAPRLDLGPPAPGVVKCSPAVGAAAEPCSRRVGEHGSGTSPGPGAPASVPRMYGGSGTSPERLDRGQRVARRLDPHAVQAVARGTPAPRPPRPAPPRSSSRRRERLDERTSASHRSGPSRSSRSTSTRPPLSLRPQQPRGEHPGVVGDQEVAGGQERRQVAEGGDPPTPRRPFGPAPADARRLGAARGPGRCGPGAGRYVEVARVLTELPTTFRYRKRSPSGESIRTSCP